MLNGSEARAYDDECGDGDDFSESELLISVESHCGWDLQEDSSPPVVLITTEAAATLVGVAGGEETAAGEEVNTCMQSEPTCMCPLPSAGAPSSCVPSSKGW